MTRGAQAAADAERGQGQFLTEVIRKRMCNELKVHNRCSFNTKRTELTCVEQNSLGSGWALAKQQEGEFVEKVTPN